MSLLNQNIKAEKGHSAVGATVTQNGRYLAPPEDKDGKVWVRTGATTLAEAETLYARWHDVEMTWPRTSFVCLNLRKHLQTANAARHHNIRFWDNWREHNIHGANE
jgi:hypothetical protein